jgi:regulator of RNase E activity RraA
MNAELYKKIIQYIRLNKISTTEIADCMGKTGAVQGVKAVNPQMFCVGIVRYVYGFNESNWSIHEQVRDILPEEIALIDGINSNDRALIGELVSKYILLYRQAAAIVALGNLRDANDLIKQRYPVWCRGFNPEGSFNSCGEETPEIKKIADERRAFYDGSIAVCDDTGVVIIPKEKINEAFFKELEFIEKQEDIWFHCLDYKKWNTFDIVCKKRYNDENLFPEDS